ncbi:cysteinyl-tRNA synthetase [Babesia microti strain RI]|uniref:cysteine--tRNA ligase n=1 Tax=Babesia microti (strain RI) TaxID=1133968 RepID=A0A1R4AAJ2_BABMR|nr:cysteinyl-tRNA synthetase [Babesia microti strain RI]SJK85984.1 cysteinyl-tRNA synthetase [Babesia microti strain RI]|eukprot:XP_021338184.1 cysteinyl-tRNA synthetase [Babesia microti strain RI]
MSLWTLFTLYNYRIAALVKRPFFIIHFPTHSATEHNKRRFKMTQSANSDIFDWSQPSTDGKHLTGLVINNSFTKSKVPFVPEKGNLVKWYSCGPTVYDHAHLGHARTYVTGDIIRRILEHLGYRVNFIMNITDVDDKIISRSSELGVDFSDFAKKWEMDFWNDMQILGVRQPNCITRVSEFIPDIIRFIEKIIERGYAYQSKGSVYFDITSFSSKHNYARMEHSSVQIKEMTLEGEESFGEVFEKKNPIDFALWKQAKEGEPFWDSPWGKGRPGWHIECSVMASHLLGDKIDIHSGGIDLRFPHHDNEVAQSEAYFDKYPWINYFLHFGHLHIQGSKMSKSLKNFITIKEFLNIYTPRQMRLLFLMCKWDSAMNYTKGPDGMQHILALDSNFSNFFPLLKSILKRTAHTNGTYQSAVMNQGNRERWDEADMELNKEHITAIDAVEAALRDNFDTPNVIHSLQRLISVTNSYITTNYAKHKKPILSEILYTVTRYLQMLGLEYNTQAVDKDTEGLIDRIINFRAKIRHAAKVGLKGDSLIACREILSLCDDLRDVDMPSIGFIMEDLPDGTGLIKKIEYNTSNDTEKNSTLDQFNKLSINKDSIEPKDYFRMLYPGKFGSFDESHIPVTYSSGEKVSKSERKSLEKLMAKHLKKYGMH